MVIPKKLRIIGKKYIPNFLKPLSYKIYAFIYHYYIMFWYKKKFITFFDTLKPLNELLKYPTVKIIQPTFYDEKGKTYLSGGAERYLVDLCYLIQKFGFKPYIIQQGIKNWHLVHEGINVFGVRSSDLFSFNSLSHHKVFGQPKLVIYSPFILAYPKIFTNSIGISHGIFWDQGHNIFNKNIKQSFAQLKIFVSVDTSTISYFRATMARITNHKKMMYISNYVDLDKYSPSKIRKPNNQNLVILFPRRLYKARGYFLVTSIIDSILAKYQNIEFHFVGQIDNSDVMKSYKNLTTKYKNKVRYYTQNADDMNLVYQKADITLIPSLMSEGTSLSCLEAMATGNAIITTNVGGLSDLIINNYNGLLIEPNSISLYNALTKLVDSSKLRNRLQKNAVEVAQAFCKKEWQQKWSSLIENTINYEK